MKKLRDILEIRSGEYLEYSDRMTTGIFAKKHQELSKHYNFNLPPKETTKNVLRRYTDTSFGINRHLWQKHLGTEGLEKSYDEKKYMPVVDAIDKHLQEYKTPKAMTVYSGTRHDPRINKD